MCDMITHPAVMRTSLPMVMFSGKAVSMMEVGSMKTSCPIFTPRHLCSVRITPRGATRTMCPRNQFRQM